MALPASNHPFYTLYRTLLFGGGLIGINVEFTAIMVFILSLLSIAYSVSFGHHYLARWLGRYAGVVSGLILIAIGFYEFWG
ncbi:hypothetical protein ACTLLP_01265 [Desulfothermobacter acidiphilus]